MALIGMLASTQAQAVIANPNPALFENDNGAIYFKHDTLSVSAEVFDLLGVPGSIFGFYFRGTDPTVAANRGVIFDELDPTNNLAVIDFGAGTIVDVEDSSVQDTFDPSLSPLDIGFFFTTSGTTETIFSDPALNPGGVDLSTAFASKDGSGLYLIGFELPTIGAITFSLLGPLTAVPEPGALSLVVLGLIVMAFASRSTRRRQLAV